MPSAFLSYSHFIFETESVSLSLSLEFTNQSGIYLPLPLKQWDYENVPPYLAFFILHGS